jgi:basic membrane protein A
VGLAAAGVAALGLGGAIVYGIATAPPPPPKAVVYMWFAEDGLTSLQAIAGFDRAVADHGLTSRKVSYGDLIGALDEELGPGVLDAMNDAEFEETVFAAQLADLRRMSREDVGLIFVEGVLVEDLDPIAAEFPDVRYAIGLRGAGSAPNVAYLTNMDAEPAFLAGAVAALTSETGTIGYIGGVDWEGIWGFQAGYEAGARAIDADITILATYLSANYDFSGFDDLPGARREALEMYAAGADVIFHAAGTSGLGLFEAATTYSDQEGRQVWAIGVDSDQYVTVMGLPGALDAEQWREHILTSMLKGIDTGTYAIVAAYAEGTFRPGVHNVGLTEDDSGISYSGGYIDHLRPTIEDLKARIISGEIVVPCIAEDRLDDAAALGIDPDYCREGLRRDVETP